VNLERATMDNIFDTYHERIIEAIREGDVVCIFFPRLGKTLILDLRQSIEAPPAIMIDNMVSNARERLESLQRMRPEFPMPDEVRLAPWVGFIRSLRDTGVYDAMIERCEQTGNSEVVQECRDAFVELERTERRLVRAIIRGDTTRTIWQRPQ
jgi:hypothetical protein